MAMIRCCAPPEPSQVSAAIEMSPAETHSMNSPTVFKHSVKFRFCTVQPKESFDMHVNLVTKTYQQEQLTVGIEKA